MGIKWAEDPFNTGMFFDIRRPSLLVHFQTLNTHIQAFHTGVAPLGLTIPRFWSTIIVDTLRQFNVSLPRMLLHVYTISSFILCCSVMQTHSVTIDSDGGKVNK